MSSTELHTLCMKSPETICAMGKHFNTSAFIAPRCIFVSPDKREYVYSVYSVDGWVSWSGRLLPVDLCFEFAIVSLNKRLA